MHKPAQQTVVPARAVAGLLRDLPIAKLRSLGGKFGEEVCTALSVSTVGGSVKDCRVLVGLLGLTAWVVLCCTF